MVKIKTIETDGQDFLGYHSHLKKIGDTIGQP